jgi:nitronate monooxygenase
VQIGTAYLLCPEADTSPVHRAALRAAAADPSAGSTALTTLFSGRPARGLVNRLMRELGPMPQGLPDFPLAGAALASLRAEEEARGSGEASPLWAGQQAASCRETSAFALTRELAAGW